MKKIKNITGAVLSLMIICFLSSCLKDSSNYIDYSTVGTLIELPLAEPQPYEPGAFGGVFQTLNYSLVSGATDTLTVAVNVASPNPLSSALNVTLSATDTTSLNAFNAANGTSFLPLPPSDYTVLGSLTVTVPAHQRLAYAKILIKAGAIGYINSGVYVLPITIESASGQPIAQPYKALFYMIGNPVISETGNVAALTTTTGTPSSSDTLTVSGVSMNSGILVTPPSGFEVSTDNINFSSTVTVGVAGTIAATGIVAPTPVYVRLAALDLPSTYSGNIVLSSNNAAAANVAIPTSTVSATPPPSGAHIRR